MDKEMVVELCPHCMEEVNMFCSECLDRGDACDYDSYLDACMFNRKEREKNGTNIPVPAK